MTNNNTLKLYRKRYIPSECIPLNSDVIVEQNDEFILTTWKTINPKTTFDHGSSCYMLKEGLKVSKFYRPDGNLLYWYCDIADVVIYPDGQVKVMDLDELAEALERGLITQKQLTAGLRQLNYLLTMLDRDKFDRLQAILNDRGL